MLSITHRITAGTALLLIMPMSVWISGWNWKPGQYSGWLNTLYWITEIVTQPWGIITHSLLCAWFLWCLRFPLRQSVMLFMILNITILAGQGIKFWIKDIVREPRPFIIWLEKIHHIQTDKFHNLKNKDHIYLIKTQIERKQDVPNFLRRHWKKEIGFSFPSGHTIFTSSWALLGIWLLWPDNCIITIAILLIWTISVMGSRLLFGMHWPHDLIVATLISWLLVTLTTWLARHVFINSLTREEKNKQ